MVLVSGVKEHLLLKLYLVSHTTHTFLTPLLVVLEFVLYLVTLLMVSTVVFLEDLMSMKLLRMVLLQV